MVVSLYICEIPKNTTKKDIEDLFIDMEGYRETRMKGTNDKRKIAFVDYEHEDEARFAMNALQGFKFSPEDKGLIIKFSDNTKNGQNQPKKDRDEYLSRKRKYSGDRMNKSRFRSSSRDHSSEKEEENVKITQNLNTNQLGNLVPNNPINLTTSMNPQNPNNIIDLINMINQNNSNLNLNPNQIIKNQINPLNTNINNNSNLLLQQDPNNTNNNNLTNLNLNHLTLPNDSSNFNPNTNNINNIIELLSNIQAVHLYNSLTGGNAQNFTQTNPDSKNLQGLNPSQNTSTHNLLSSHLINNPNVNVNQNFNNSVSNSKATKFLNSLHKFDDKFKQFLDFKKNATNIVYVEGLPLNTSEREVAHLFRPFPGFKSVRLITREKSGEKSLICFADFEDILQATICINTLQGYRFDKNDLVGLHFSYGVTKSKK